MSSWSKIVLLRYLRVSKPHTRGQQRRCGVRALRAGIKDAIAGGVAAALNDYLDLLAGVLILWYGGTIAMHPAGAISVGQLITYQVRVARSRCPHRWRTPLPPRLPPPLS